MTALLADATELQYADADQTLQAIAHGLGDGAVIPFLGPGIASLSDPEFPTTPEKLADFLGSKVTLPQRARGNVWAAAQYIESVKHRATVTALMSEAFAPRVDPGPFYTFLASLPVPLIIDTWYDGTMREALRTRQGWGEIQGISRAGISENQWYRYYDHAGEEVTAGQANAWTTLLYKPHGGVAPVQNFLISDADYVEVLTEIDIQTPIPDIIKDRRADRTFLFIGCRFHDQMLRTYARQIMKRSGTEHFAIVEPDSLTKNEIRFLAAQDITPIAVDLSRAIDLLINAA